MKTNKDTENEVENEVAAGSEEVAKDTQLENNSEDEMGHISDFVQSCDDEECAHMEKCLAERKSKRPKKDKLYSLDNVEKSLDEPEELEDEEMND